MPICDLNGVYQNALSLKDASSNTCRFHKAPLIIKSSDAGPAGLCPEVYYLAYPYLFAMVYGGNIGPEKGFQLTCPNADAKVKFEVIKTGISLYDKVKNLVKIAISSFFHVVRMRCGIDLKLVDMQHSLPDQCPHLSADKGKVYHINFGQFNDLCPAAFRSLFPYYALNYMKKRAGKTLITDLVACPDHKKNLMFDISGISAGNSEQDAELICNAADGTTIQAIESSSLNIEPGAAFSIGGVIKGLHFPCPILLNVGIPYYLTLYHGGALGFYTYKPNSAIIQCPNTKMRVTAEVALENNKVIFKIIDIAGERSCPRNIRSGDIFELPVDEKNRSVIETLNFLIFYSILSKEVSGALVLNNIIDQAQFRIEHSK